MSESLNSQSLIAHSKDQSSTPFITVQIVEESVLTALSLDVMFPGLDGGARAGRMGGIVPPRLANFQSRRSGPLSDALREQLKDFASTQSGAKCLKYLGYCFDIQEPSDQTKEQEQAALLSVEPVFQALDGGSRAGRMGAIVPLSLANLHSRPIRPLRGDLKEKLKEFASTKRGAKCLKYFGYYFDTRESKAAPIAVNSETSALASSKSNVLPIKAELARPALKSDSKVVRLSTHELWLNQQSRQVQQASQVQQVQKIQQGQQADLNSKSNVEAIPNASKEKRLEATLTPHQKQLRQVILWVASICLVICCAAEMQHLSQKQSMQQIAMKKLSAGDLSGAKVNFEKVIQTEPENWEAYLGHAATIPGEYAKQIRDYNHVLAIKPGESHAVNGLAKSYYELGDYSNAIIFANKSYAQSSSIESLELKAKSLMHLRYFADASKVFQQVLAIPSKRNAELYYTLASCQKKIGNRNQQVEYLRKASELDPKNTSYLNELAMLQVAGNELEDAKVTLQKAVSLNKAEPTFHVRLAKVLTQLNSPNRAISELNQVIDNGRGPKADILKQRALLYCSTNNYGRALSDVESALVLKPTDKFLPVLRQRIVHQLAVIKAGLDRQLAKNYRDSNNTRVALSPTEASSPVKSTATPSANEGTHSQQMVLKAYKHIKNGDLKAAIPVLETAVKHDPDNSQAHRYLAFSYLNSGMVTKALAHSKQVVALGTEHPHDLYSLGEAHFYDGKPQEAMKFYRDALRINPLHVEARMGAIRSLIALGKVEEAKSICEAAAYNSRSEKAKFQFKRMLNDIKSKNQIASSRSFRS